MLDQEISGSLGFTALHYTLSTRHMAEAVVPAHGVWLHIERDGRGAFSALEFAHAAALSRRRTYAPLCICTRVRHTPWPSRAPFARAAPLVCTHTSR